MNPTHINMNLYMIICIRHQLLFQEQQIVAPHTMMAHLFLTFNNRKETIIMKALVLIGIIYGFLSVALGAFGAHALEGKISESAILTWEKAVHYQMFHALSILLAGFALIKFDSTALL